MTSLSRRKRQTTVHACHTLAARTINILGLALLLLGGRAQAQQPALPAYPVQQGAQLRGDVVVIPTTSPYAVAQPAVYQPTADQGLPPFNPPTLNAPLVQPGTQGISQVRYQGGILTYNPNPDELLSVTPPGFEAIFNHLDSEHNLQERIRQGKGDSSANQHPPELAPKIEFPDEKVPNTGDYQGRQWPRRATFAEPNYVIYDRLYFEDINSERYGWDLGFIGPFVGTGLALKDLLLFPMHAGTDMFRQHEANAGYCLPGDNVPYLLYPPEVSLTGAMLEAASAVTILAVFP